MNKNTFALTLLLLFLSSILEGAKSGSDAFELGIGYAKFKTETKNVYGTLVENDDFGGVLFKAGANYNLFQSKGTIDWGLDSGMDYILVPEISARDFKFKASSFTTNLRPYLIISEAYLNDSIVFANFGYSNEQFEASPGPLSGSESLGSFFTGIGIEFNWANDGGELRFTPSVNKAFSDDLDSWILSLLVTFSKSEFLEVNLEYTFTAYEDKYPHFLTSDLLMSEYTLSVDLNF